MEPSQFFLGKSPGDEVAEPSRKGRLSLGCSGKGCCEVTRKKMSCFRAFDSNLPVHVGGEGGGRSGLAGSGGRTEKRE